MGLDLILRYFPDLTDTQRDQFERMGPAYVHWNGQINVVSRKDAENMYERHILHSLAIAKLFRFQPGSQILDIGTGGGFPGLPLAVLHPDVDFWLVDSIGKKIKVVNEVCGELGITNVKATHQRAETVNKKFDFVVSRAVTRFENFLPWTRGKFRQDMRNAFPNGILYLKGGDLSEEMKAVHQDYDIFDLTDWFKEEFFETKKLVYVRMVD